MTGTRFDPDDDLRAGAPPDVLARARPVGPDPELAADADDGGAEAETEVEEEPWNVPVPPPPPPRLRERTVDDVMDRIRELTLPQARAFLRAYGQIPRSELDVSGWATGFGAETAARADPPTLEQIVNGRAGLREGAIREARANGAEMDPDPLTVRAREAVVESLSHASLRGGGIEEATVAAEVAAQDATIALALRPWISEWRFQELVEPWVTAFSVVATETQSFDVLGAIALALGVLALATFGLGRSSVTSADLPAVVFALLSAITLIARWRIRRTSVAP